MFKLNCARYLFSFKNVNAVVPARECSKVKEKWDLACAVCLERKPVITRDRDEMESKMDDLLRKVEAEQSYKSNFERRMEEDERRRKLIKSGKLSVEQLDEVVQQTALDFLDGCLAEANSFKLAPRVFPQAEDDVKSTLRALDKHLLLLVKEKLGDSSLWLLPQGLRKDEETLRETAERVLKEKCGEDVEARFYGNAPNGFYKYKYPKAVRDRSVGLKIFFYKAQLMSGSVKLDRATQDYQWATRSQLSLLQPQYLKSVQMFLIDEH